MASEPIIQCFQEEFDRFWGMFEQQIALCPDDLWDRPAGGYPVWQQMAHTIACVEMFALPDPATPTRIIGARFSMETVMFAPSAEKAGKEEMLRLSRQAKDLGDAFLSSLTTASLTAPHARTSARRGTPQTMQNAAIALVRHCAYHVGCCDAVSRDQHKGRALNRFQNEIRL